MNTSEVDFQRRLFSVGEAADYLRISRTMVFKLLRQRKLTPTKIGTRTLIAARPSNACWPGHVNKTR